MGLFNFFRRTRVTEAVKRDDDVGWRSAAAFNSGTPLNPDRDELHGEALLRAAYQAYTTNPLAYAVAEQTTSFVLGGGAQVVAKDARVQKVLDRFWNDVENDMPRRIYAMHTELCVFGEQFVRLFVDRLTGRTLIRQLDPLYVKSIETDPEDLEKPLRYLYQPQRGWVGGQGRGGGENQEEPLGGVWIPARDVLHLTINRVTGTLRGRSDLATVLPWIRRYTDWLENRCRLNKLKTNLVWDLKAEGASPEEVARLRALYGSPPPPGSVLVHNERETWSSVRPEIDAGDAAPDGRAIRLMVATGAILPEHYLAEGGNVNRATAAEMGLPSIKRFQRRQQLFRAFLTRLLDRVLDEAQNAGRLGPRVDRSFAVHLEDISPAAPLSGAETLESLSRALTLALDREIVSLADAQRLWQRFAAHADDSAAQPEQVVAG
ncbi:MAG TPA: hypothetical protein VFX49_01245 [Chloroflexota bacterium]|nr:hypothetical protein [Chloroflexota bacterium]